MEDKIITKKNAYQYMMMQFFGQIPLEEWGIAVKIYEANITELAWQAIEKIGFQREVNLKYIDMLKNSKTVLIGLINR